MEEQKDKRKKLRSYAKYSNLAFQMIAIILIGVFGGMKLDEWLELSFPIFTVVLSVTAVLFSMYYAVKDFIK